ncbi:MAG: hypothetical protein M3P04_01905 [Actinomycetota bacterium]|nr:hypothetical protein [Actinomycetota bacterium]
MGALTSQVLAATVQAANATIQVADALEQTLPQLVATTAQILALLEAPEQAPPVARQELINGSAAPGTSYVYTASVPILPLSAMCRLTTSGVAGDRSLTLEYRDGTGQRYLVQGANTTVPASQTQAFCWYPQSGVGSWPVDDAAIGPLSQQTIPYGHQIVIRLVNGDTADQIDQIRVSAEFQA